MGYYHMMLSPERRRSDDTTGTATAGAVLGVVFGIALQGGIWCFASAFSFALFGNVVSALRSGELLSLFGGGGWIGRRYYNREENPVWFWVGVLSELAFAILLLAVFFRQRGLSLGAAE